MEIHKNKKDNIIPEPIVTMASMTSHVLPGKPRRLSVRAVKRQKISYDPRFHYKNLPTFAFGDFITKIGHLIFPQA